MEHPLIELYADVALNAHRRFIEAPIDNFNNRVDRKCGEKYKRWNKQHVSQHIFLPTVSPQ
ncbi:hypothetical protein D3C80_1897170 [compost metagenome]